MISGNRLTCITIKTAEQYRADLEEKLQAIRTKELEKAVEFIHEEVRPQIEDSIEHPEKYTNVGVLSFEVKVYPAEKFVEQVKFLLEPLGYTVKQSHDGGGQHATIVITWKA